MDMHCLVGAYLHAKFQRNCPSSYRYIAIVTKGLQLAAGGDNEVDNAYSVITSLVQKNAVCET